MTKAVIKFTRGVMKLPSWVPAWLLVLMGANLVAPLFFLDRPEAQVTIAVFMISAVGMFALTARFGFTRILGLGHVLWIPLIVYLLSRPGGIPAADPFGIWIRAVIGLNGISLLMDAADVVRYIRGERGEMVEGL